MKRGKPGSKPATIHDVAAAAGVSAKTVSRVLNREPNVRGEVRGRVEATMRELRYHPSQSARSLATRRSSLVGLFHDNLSPSYLLRIQSGALWRCQEERYKVLFHACDARNRKLGAEIVALARQLHLEGLILTPPLSGNATLVRELLASGSPVAQVAPRGNDAGTLNTLIDDTSASRTLTEHVIGLAHRRIAFVLGHPDHDATAQRYAGYKQALQTHKIKLDPALVSPGNFSFESGRAAALKLLTGRYKPTAIIASNDDMAAGVMAVAHGLDLQLPRDLSVCGFDDTPVARAMWPQLTTMHQPIADMAYSAVDMLLKRIRTGATPAEPVRHSFTLVVRNSTAPPAARGSD
jgi:LacI family transcriptional regulator